MRSTRWVWGFLLAAVTGAGCSGSDDGDDGGTGPGPGGGGTITLTSTEKNAVSANLNALATRVGAADAEARRFINALAFAVQQASTATEVDVATSLNVLAGASSAAPPAAVAALVGQVTRRVLGYSVSVRTDQPGQRTYRGAIVWDAAGSNVLVSVLGNPNNLNVTLPLAGNGVYLIGGQTQVWAATAGTISWTLFNGASEDCPRPLPNVLSVCGYEDGSAPFTVPASAPVTFAGNTATGSRTASLGSARIRVLFISIICGVQGGPC